ncbi:hypothetical protein SKAU_G00130920 [Synaphobranchus kaupii]|uniref:Uncharacterized protein n=1 Tax=Synaphobranchus kaupii TaxID=118154 RepID=A0A9Q1FQX5_SYNKA|nr:hypothetical protein SKAU_G00130920 [Synaphobranchus kaupii]
MKAKTPPSHLLIMTSNPATASSCSQALNRLTHWTPTSRFPFPGRKTPGGGHRMEQELGCLSSSTLNPQPPSLLVTTEDELERVAKPTEMKDTNCTLQLLIVEQKSIKSNPAGQENKVIVIHRLVKLGPLQPRQLRRLQEILHMARTSHLILDLVVKAINPLPSRGYIHMDELFREVSMLPSVLDRTVVQKLEIIFKSEKQMTCSFH